MTTTEVEQGSELALTILKEFSQRTGEAQKELERTYARTYALASCVHDGLAVATDGGIDRMWQLLRSIRHYPIRFPNG